MPGLKDDVSALEDQVHTFLRSLDQPCEGADSDAYIVYLRPGHGLAEHAAALARNGKAARISHVFDFIAEQVVYVAKPCAEELLDAIRRDPEVERVQMLDVAVGED